VTEETTTSAIAAAQAGGHGAGPGKAASEDLGKPQGRRGSGPESASATDPRRAGVGSASTRTPAGAGDAGARVDGTASDQISTAPDQISTAPDQISTGSDQIGTARLGETSLDRVTVRMPADGAYLSVLRTATAGLAARLDFTLDDIEDLRIAVDEACAMLLSQAVPCSSLECSFTLSADDMTISVSVPSLNPRTPSGETFAWTVLSALAGTVEAQVGPGDRLAIVMRKSRPSSRSV
jgi:serine/threonine-protein kinase RsbW